MGTKIFTPFLLVLWIGGCPKRQSGARIVYLPAPAPGATAAAPPSGGTLVIEEPAPAPPAPAPSPPPPEPAPRPPASVHRPSRPRNAADEKPAPAEAAPPATSSEAPLLQPREHGAGDVQLQSQLGALQHRIDQLEGRRDLVARDRQTLADAKTFLSQSQLAFTDHDLLRARQLAQKASLLLTALEQQP